MRKEIDLKGKTFGRLKVVEQAAAKSYGKVCWECICSCGKGTTVLGRSLRSGATQSCGCLRREYTAIHRTTHGRTKSQAYRAWAAMLSRCYNPNIKNYHNYGGRGIKVCKRWHKFENFYHDLGEPPVGRSLDRIDNNKNYSPKNCRWASSTEQNRNRRNNIYLEYKGERRVMSEWAEIYKIEQRTLRTRLIRSSWSVERALTEPIRPCSRKK